MLDLQEIGNLPLPAAGRLRVLSKFPLEKLDLVLGESRLRFGLLCVLQIPRAHHGTLLLLKLSKHIQLLIGVREWISGMGWRGTEGLHVVVRSIAAAVQGEVIHG